MKYICLFLISLALLNEALAQCCSVGSPVGGTTSIGTLPSNNLRATLFYRYGYGNRYIAGDGKETEGGVKQAYSSFTGLFADFGITNDFTLSVELGYFLNKVQDWDTVGIFQTSGFSSAVLMGKYNFLNDTEDEFEFTAGLGAKIPFSTIPQKIITSKGFTVLPRDVQPTPGAFGSVAMLFLHKGFSESSTHLFLVHRIEINGTNSNDYDYQYGNTFNTSLFMTKMIVPNLIGILQLRNEIKEKDQEEGAEIPNSGGILFFISPQLNFSFSNFFISALFDYPLYRYYNKRQLAGKYSFALNFIWQMDLSGD